MFGDGVLDGVVYMIVVLVGWMVKFEYVDFFFVDQDVARCYCFFIGSDGCDDYMVLYDEGELMLGVGALGWGWYFDYLFEGFVVRLSSVYGVLISGFRGHPFELCVGWYCLYLEGYGVSSEGDRNVIFGFGWGYVGR